MMEDKELEQFERLAELFGERDQSYREHTQKIFEAIGPTIIEALYDLFETPYENVAWLEVQAAEGILLIVASIVYDDETKIPDIIQRLTPKPPEGAIMAGRLFRVGIPLDLVFAPKEVILEYLKDTAKGVQQPRTRRNVEQQEKVKENKEDNSVPINKLAVKDFDSSQLTKEQIQQIIVFQDATRGTKH